MLGKVRGTSSQACTGHFLHLCTCNSIVLYSTKHWGHAPLNSFEMVGTVDAVTESIWFEYPLDCFTTICIST